MSGQGVTLIYNEDNFNDRVAGKNSDSDSDSDRSSKSYSDSNSDSDSDSDCEICPKIKNLTKKSYSRYKIGYMNMFFITGHYIEKDRKIQLINIGVFLDLPCSGVKHFTNPFRILFLC